MKFYFLCVFIILNLCGYTQHQSILIDAELNTVKNTLKIQQETKIFNTSKDTLSFLYFHNWMHSYRDKKTPLSKRLLSDYNNDLFFSKKKNLGYSEITKISNKYESTPLIIDDTIPDILKIQLSKPLLPNDSIVISADYVVKISKGQFTKYGRNKNDYNLRFWHITPAVYTNKWQIMSNYNLDDQFSTPTDYIINLRIPDKYTLNTDLDLIATNKKNNFITYHLKGMQRVDLELNITNKNSFLEIETTKPKITSNLNTNTLHRNNTTAILERQLQFIASYLGKYPHEKLLINKITYEKNPVYGLNQLPKILNPFNNVFEFDIKMFKALSHKYINNTIITNRRKDNWLNDGIQTYLMMKYVEKFYPDINSIGSLSKIWGLRKYQLAKLKFNDKYAFVNLFSMRKNLDQALTTSSDSLSTFNRKIINKYKAGLGLQYLDAYLQDSIITQSLQQFYSENLLKTTHSKEFEKILSSKTKKEVNWFFEDYLQSKKKIDYTITSAKINKDSIDVVIKNKSDISTPIAIYGLQNKKIKYKAWFTGIDSIKTIKIPKGDFNKISLNYENLYPELNLYDNWKNIKPTLFNRPFQFRYWKDLDNPFYNQIFYNVEYDYDFYNGVSLGLSLSNKTFVKKKWRYKIQPIYGTKSKQLNGTLGFVYTNYPINWDIYKIRAGFSTSISQYAPNLNYRKISPFVSFDFHRNNLRDVGGSSLLTRFTSIKKEVEENKPQLESDNYHVFNLRYSFYKPEIITDLRYNFDLQLATKFSKIAAEFHYRKLTHKNRQFDIRFYAGSFLHNKTTSTFFDFSLNRPSDYLFDYSYFGRSEKTGFFSQQIIIAEGGFKSFFTNNTANKWMLSNNTSMSLWRWIEIYGDVGIYKNNHSKAQFKYDSGIRLNFVHNFFEVYFPIQSSNGFEPKQANYPERIRFVLTLSFGKIYNFAKRGFY